MSEALTILLIAAVIIAIFIGASYAEDANMRAIQQPRHEKPSAIAQPHYDVRPAIEEPHAEVR